MEWHATHKKAYDDALAKYGNIEITLGSVEIRR